MDEWLDGLQRPLDELSEKFQALIKRQIMENGNGSGVMRDEAVKHVHEIARRTIGGVIEMEVGVDERELYSDEQARIRTLVSIYGNIQKDTGTLWTKPGEQTWRKHVNFKAESTAKTAYPLYRFVQYDVSGKLMENAMKEIDMYIRDFLNVVAGMTGSVLNWVDCIIVR